MKKLLSLGITFLLLASTFSSFIFISPVKARPKSGKSESMDRITLECLSKDKDLDGILDEWEQRYPFAYWLDPKVTNELLKSVTHFLGTDGLNKNEETLIEFLSNMEMNLLPPNVTMYYKYGEVVEGRYGDRKELGYHYWTYVTPNEIKWYQTLLLNSVLKDGKVSTYEANSLKFLDNYKGQGRWYLILDIIASGMINDEFLDLDFDLDGINNYDELERGTNPLNELEIEPENLSERYAILTPPLYEGCPPCEYSYLLDLYHALRKHGYSDDRIFLVLPRLNSCYQSYMLSFLRGKDLLNDLGEVEIDFNETNPGKIIDRIANCFQCWDSNDEIVVFEFGHGGMISGKRDFLIKLTTRWQPYGRIVWFRSTCSSGSFFESTLVNTNIKNFIGVASSLPFSTGGFSYLFEKLFMDFHFIIPECSRARHPFELGKPNLFSSLQSMADENSINYVDEMHFYFSKEKERWIDWWNPIHYIAHPYFRALTTVFASSGVLGEGGWYTSDVEVVALSTVDRIRCRVPGIGTWYNIFSPLLIDVEGCTSIYCTFEDMPVANVSIKIDKTSPSGSIIINNGDAYTNSTLVTLTLTAADATSGVHQVRYSNDGIWDNEPWESFVRTKFWIIPEVDGVKTVYVQFMDKAGLISTTYSDTIILDTTAPSVVASKCLPEGDVKPDQGVKILVNAIDSLSGVGKVILSYNINNSPIWTYITMTLNTTIGLYEATIPGQQANSLVKYKIIAYDNAGNFAVEDNDGKYYVYTVLKFLVSDLSISPVEAKAKQTITISVKVTNVGEQAGTYSVNLKLNGTLVDSKTVSLKGGESTVVTFQVITDKVGTFNVEVDGLKGAFTVKQIQLPWVSCAIITAVVVVTASVIITMFAKKRRASYRSMEDPRETPLTRKVAETLKTYLDFKAGFTVMDKDL